MELPSSDQGSNSRSDAKPAISAANATSAHEVLLSDLPLRGDSAESLGFSAYVDALSGIIGDPRTSTPLTIAISAAWGAGKTSLAQMINDKLRNEELYPHRQNITCWFNAWMHDDAPNLGTALAAKVARDINQYRPRWRRLISPLPSAFYSPQERWQRRLIMAIVSLVAVAAAAAVPTVRTFLHQSVSRLPLSAEINASLTARWASAAILLVAIVYAFRKVFAAAQATARFVDDPQSEAAKGSMQSVHDQLAGLIAQASKRGSWLRRDDLAPARLVIFVDDLERCRAARAVEVCETANQLLSIPGLVTILIGDMEAVAYSAATMYLPNASQYAPRQPQDSPATTLSPYAFGRAYLEKIVQVQFSVPVPGAGAIRDMLTSIGDMASYAPASGAHAAPGRDPAPDRLAQITRLRIWTSRLRLLTGSTVFAVWILLLFVTRLPGYIDFLIGFGVAMVVSIPYTAINNRLEQLTGTGNAEEIDKYIRDTYNPDKSVQNLQAAVQQSGLGSHEVLAQHVQRFLVDESELRKEAEKTVGDFAPALPRAAKRTINQLRVALAVAVRRRMFDSPSSLRPEQLGKWVVLTERWPAFAKVLVAQPQEITRLEALSTDALAPAVLDKVPDLQDADALCKLLQAPPLLQSVLDHLVRFEPWALAAASSPAAVPDKRASDDHVPQQREAEPATPAESATPAEPAEAPGRLS
jgi:hypothetical protein